MADIRVWKDYLKPGEGTPMSRAGRIAWCASRSENGHVVKISTGHATKEEAMLAVGATDMKPTTMTARAS